MPLLILIVRNKFALAHEGRPVQYVKPPEGIMQRKVWMGELKHIVMDGCMLLKKKKKFYNQWKLQRAKKTRIVLFSGARKEFTNETSDRCLQELNLLCCWQLSTLYTCNNLSTVSGACSWSTRGSSINFVRAVRAAFFEHVMPFTTSVSHETWWGWQQVYLLI